MDRTRIVVSPAISTGVTDGLLVGMSFLSGIIAARALGPAGRGEFAVVLLWPTLLAAVGGLGVREALTYYLASGQAAPSKLLGAALMSATFQSLLLVLIGILLIPIVTISYDSIVTRTSLIYLLFIPTNLIAQYSLGLLQGSLNLGAFNAVRLSVNIIYLTFLFFFLVTASVTVRNLTMAMLFANLCTALIGLGLAGRRFGISAALDRQLYRGLYRYGLKNHAGSLSSMLNQRVDQLIMSLLISTQNLGWYAVAVSVSSIVTTAAAAISAILFPKVAGSASGMQSPIAVRYSRVNVTVSAILAAFMALITPFALPIIYGRAYMPSVILAEVLIVGALFTAFGMSWAAILRGIGNPLATAQAELLALGMTGVGLVILLPSIGILGAAITSLLAYGASALLMLHSLNRSLGLRPRELLMPHSLRTVMRVLTKG